MNLEESGKSLEVNNLPIIRCCKISTTNHRMKFNEEYMIEAIGEADILYRLKVLTKPEGIIYNYIGSDIWENVNSKDAWQNHFQPCFDKVIYRAKLDKTALIHENSLEDFISKLEYYYSVLKSDPEWDASLKKCLDELISMLKAVDRTSKNESRIEIITGGPKSWVDERPSALERHIEYYIKNHGAGEWEKWRDKSFEVIWTPQIPFISNSFKTAEVCYKIGIVLRYHDEIPLKERGEWEMLQDAEKAAEIGREEFRKAEEEWQKWKENSDFIDDIFG